jgi:hypothetical protein
MATDFRCSSVIVSCVSAIAGFSAPRRCVMPPLRWKFDGIADPAAVAFAGRYAD